MRLRSGSLQAKEPRYSRGRISETAFTWRREIAVSASSRSRRTNRKPVQPNSRWPSGARVSKSWIVVLGGGAHRLAGRLAEAHANARGLSVLVVGTSRRTPPCSSARSRARGRVARPQVRAQVTDGIALLQQVAGRLHAARRGPHHPGQQHDAALAGPTPLDRGPQNAPLWSASAATAGERWPGGTPATSCGAGQRAPSGRQNPSLRSGRQAMTACE